MNALNLDRQPSFCMHEQISHPILKVIYCLKKNFHDGEVREQQFVKIYRCIKNDTENKHNPVHPQKANCMEIFPKIVNKSQPSNGNELYTCLIRITSLFLSIYLLEFLQLFLLTPTLTQLRTSTVTSPIQAGCVVLLTNTRWEYALPNTGL